MQLGLGLGSGRLRVDSDAAVKAGARGVRDRDFERWRRAVQPVLVPGMKTQPSNSCRLIHVNPRPIEIGEVDVFVIGQVDHVLPVNLGGLDWLLTRGVGHGDVDTTSRSGWYRALLMVMFQIEVFAIAARDLRSG